MRNVKEILRQKWEMRRSNREVARSVGVSVGAVSGVTNRAKAAGLDIAQVKELDEEQLSRKLYGLPASYSHNRPLPSLAYIHKELHKKGVTLQLLHLEYIEQNPEGYKYTQFCEYYSRWLKKRGLTMRQNHRAGEKMFVDYSGKKPHIVDAKTGEIIDVELFVAVLGASSYSYAEATMSQKVEDFIGSHVRAFEYFGGVCEVVVPDQLRSAVSKPCRYEPEIQRSYQEMASHYGTVVIPARPYKPRDKAKAETAVLVVQRWVLARLRNQTFFSLAELNERIVELVDDLNRRTMKIYGKSRQQLFDSLDKPAMKPLPVHRFVYGRWKLDMGVNIDYCINLDYHNYSVPFQLIGEQVDARVSGLTVEIFHKGKRVATHLRSFRRGGFTIDPNHMPKSHQGHLKWTPSRLILWGESIGANTAKLVEQILKDRPHPEQGYRSCLGIFRLGKTYGDERLENACARAVCVGARSYKHVEAILKNGLDRVPYVQDKTEPKQMILLHDNVRGAEYYSQTKENKIYEH